MDQKYDKFSNTHHNILFCNRMLCKTKKHPIANCSSIGSHDGSWSIQYLEIGTIFPWGCWSYAIHLSVDATESLAMEGSNKDDRKPRTEMWLAAVRLVDRSSTCNGQQPNVSCVVLLFLSGSIDGLVSLSWRDQKNYCFSDILIPPFHFKQFLKFCRITNMNFLQYF